MAIDSSGKEKKLDIKQSKAAGKTTWPLNWINLAEHVHESSDECHKSLQNISCL